MLREIGREQETNRVQNELRIETYVLQELTEKKLQISYVDVGNLKQQFVKMSEVTIFITSFQSDLEELTCQY